MLSVPAANEVQKCGREYRSAHEHFIAKPAVVLFF